MNPPSSLVDLHQLDVKIQRRPRRNDVTGSTITIGQPRRDDQLTTRPGTHVEQTLVPSLDHLTLAQGELERLAAVQARVELGAVRQRTCRVTAGQVRSWSCQGRGRAAQGQGRDRAGTGKGRIRQDHIKVGLGQVRQCLVRSGRVR